MSWHSFPVSPDAVRVWRGFKSPDLGVEQFHEQLGKIFIPATVKMQVKAGLNSYAPTVLAGLTNKPDSVPDETAIVFWKSQQEYENAQDMLAVGSYELNHKVVFDFKIRKSLSEFPVLFTGSLAEEKPVYLFDKAADWMHGLIRHVVAAFPAGVGPAEFRATIAETLSTIKKTEKLDGAIACAGKGYVVYWELALVKPGSGNTPSGIPLLKEKLAGWCQEFTAEPAFLPLGLWERWPGMTVIAGNSFNLQFDRVALA